MNKAQSCRTRQTQSPYYQSVYHSVSSVAHTISEIESHSLPTAESPVPHTLKLRQTQHISYGIYWSPIRMHTVHGSDLTSNLAVSSLSISKVHNWLRMVQDHTIEANTMQDSKQEAIEHKPSLSSSSTSHITRQLG
jgi:hypothetical protein